MKTSTTKIYASFLMITLLTGCGALKGDDENDDDEETEVVQPTAAPVSNGQPEDNGTGVSDDGSSTHQACVPGPAPVFTHDITENDKIFTVSPLGQSGEAGRMIVGRSYVTMKPELKGTPTRVAIYAPVDLKVVGGERNYDPNIVTENPEAWAFQIEVTCKVSMYLAHVKGPVPKLAAAFTIGPDGKAPRGSMKYPVSFKAGEKIGEIQADSDTDGFDFVVSDKDVTETGQANPARYAGLDWTHQVCPWTHFTDELRDIYLAKLGTRERVVPGTECGNINNDVKGSLMGQWFLNKDAKTAMGELIEVTKGTNVYGNPLPISVTPEGMVYVNHVIGQQARFVIENPTVLPKDILTGTEHCYNARFLPAEVDADMGWVYFQMTSDMEMKVNYGLSGTCPASFPEANAMTYYR